ncbi:hypothetical protein NDU88_003011 [Pleurodeles waltl]|uniref:Uncharacterized protein n=1 Tax=Pleurodeles waltl TaxID=8319 RepID=A0AAV7VC83_PLEWA|nr:hypothetical protein NDU88_003011 [Pleurodeles waltl]
MVGVWAGERAFGSAPSPGRSRSRLWGGAGGGGRAWVGPRGDPGECRNRPVSEIGGRRPEHAAKAEALRWAAIRSSVRADGSEQRGTPGESSSGGDGAGGGLGAQVRSRPAGVRRGGAPGGGRPLENTGAGPRLRLWPRAGLRAEAARGQRIAGDPRGVFLLRRRYRLGPGGPTEDALCWAAKRRYSWTRARPQKGSGTERGRARESDGAKRRRGDGVTRGQTERPLDLRWSSGPWQTPKKRSALRTTGPGEPL